MGLIDKANNLRVADNSSLNSHELNDRQSGNSPSPKQGGDPSSHSNITPL